jgi:hypothetical protein
VFAVGINFASTEGVVNVNVVNFARGKNELLVFAVAEIVFGNQ